MKSPVRKVTVTVLGEQYHLVSDEDEQVLRHATRMVESMLQELHERTRDSHVEPYKLATLVALRMATASCIKEHEFVQRTQHMISLFDKSHLSS